MTELLTRPRKTGLRYPHLPGSAGHSSPKKPAGLRRKPDLALYPAGATLRGAVNLLSLVGVYQPKKKMEESKLPVALTRFLDDHPHVKTVYLHLDNDTAGRLAAKAITAVMPEGYRVENKPPPRGKDVNDFLCHRLGIPIRGSHGKEPER